LPETSREQSVQLNGYDRRAPAQKLVGQRATSRANLDDRIASAGTDRGGYAAEDSSVIQEMLTEAFSGAWARGTRVALVVVRHEQRF